MAVSLIPNWVQEFPGIGRSSKGKYEIDTYTNTGSMYVWCTYCALDFNKDEMM